MNVPENNGVNRESAQSKRGVYWMLVGLLLAGLAAGYRWWRDLPK